MMCAVFLTSGLEAQTKFSMKDEDWDSTFPQWPPQVQKLMLAIKATDLHPYLLSELKKHTLLVTHLKVLEDSLVVIDIEEGHGGENVVFDFDAEEGWSIIRRSPQADWKPKEQRRGGRLTRILFPTESRKPQPSTQQ